MYFTKKGTMKKRKVFLFLVLATIFSSSLSAQSIRSLLRKGKQQYEVRAYTKAIETYQQILSRRDNQVEALSYIAECYRQLNQMEEAADHFAQAVQQVSQVEPIHILNFGKTLKALGRYGQAEQVFRIYAERNAPLGNHYAASCEFAASRQEMKSEFQVTNEPINSTAADFGPTFYLDQVAFSSGRTDVQRSTYDWDGQAKNQLFVAQVGIDGLLQPARFLKGTATNRSEGPVSFSATGEKVAFTINDFISGIRSVPGPGNELVLYLADLGSNGAWFNEKPFRHNTSDSQTGYPCFTPDGSAMFFASNRNGGYGGYDLYIAYREGNNWSIPINLGPTVNSAGDEISPFYDGQTLYFASDYHYGFGGFDIFSATEDNGVWEKVTNLGQPVNSSRDDFGYIYDDFKNIGYFSSNRPGGRGAEDIYKVSKSSMANITLRVVSAVDGSPVSFANIDLSGLGSAVSGGNTRVVTDSRGVYTFPKPYNINGEIVITSPGYLAENYQLNLARLEENNNEVTIRLSPEGNLYVGGVVSYIGNRPLSNVTITARNLNSGTSRQTQTNPSGNFQINLEANTPYMIIYSAPGYREIRRNINTASLPANELGVLPLATTSDIGDPRPPNPPDNSNTVRSGFAIQLGAVAKRPDLSRYNDLRALNAGEVYLKESASLYRIRYGVFPDRLTANRYLSAVKAKGYPDAYIVEEEGVSSGQTGGGAPVTPPVTNNPNQGNYKIQLAALSSTRWFNPSTPVLSLGRIEDRTRGNLTIKLLSSFSSLEAARRALSIVKENGFPTAFIVLDQNGTLERIKN